MTSPDAPGTDPAAPGTGPAGPTDPTEVWAGRAAAALGLDDDVPVSEVLDLARVVAHAVERKAAPVSAFLAGLAAGRRGGSAEDVARAIEVLTDLAAGARDEV